MSRRRCGPRRLRSGGWAGRGRLARSISRNSVASTRPPPCWRIRSVSASAGVSERLVWVWIIGIPPGFARAAFTVSGWKMPERTGAIAGDGPVRTDVGGIQARKGAAASVRSVRPAQPIGLICSATCEGRAGDSHRGLPSCWRMAPKCRRGRVCVKPLPGSFTEVAPFAPHAALAETGSALLTLSRDLIGSLHPLAERP